MAKRKAESETTHINEGGLKKLRKEDDVIENISSQELYSNYNMKTILKHYFKNRIVDLDLYVISYDSKKTQREQWLKQQNKHIKKLKIDLNKFESKSFQEKFYITGTKDPENKIISAAIIRCFEENKEPQIGIIPLINYVYSVTYNGVLNLDDVTMEYMNYFLAKRSCTSLIRKEAIMMSQFTEILKIYIEGILDQDTNIEEKINVILQAKKSVRDYINTHKEILAQYPNCEHDSYDTGEEEEDLAIVEVRTEDNENTELTVKIKNPTNKKVTWSNSVIENEMGSYRIRDREAIETFAEAVKECDVELVKEAKDKSVDFRGLVNYFNNEIKSAFWGDFYRNFARKLDITEETDPAKKIINTKKHNDFVNQVADFYNLLMDNTPGFLDKMQIEQDHIIGTLPEVRKQLAEKDFIKVIANDIRNKAVITDNFKKIGAVLESHSYSMNLRIEKVEEQKHSNYNRDVTENLTAFITVKVSPEEAILRHSILFEKQPLKDFKDSSNTDASINALLISESTSILGNIPACERSQISSMENGAELSITGINLLKDNTTGTPLIQHHLTAKFLVCSQSIPETRSVQVIEPMVVAMASVSLDEKLQAQVLHYLRKGEAFDNLRSAMENGAVRVIIQPSAVLDKGVDNIVPSVSSVQTYHEETHGDSGEVLHPTAELST